MKEKRTSEELKGKQTSEELKGRKVEPVIPHKINICECVIIHFVLIHLVSDFYYIYVYIFFNSVIMRKPLNNMEEK